MQKTNKARTILQTAAVATLCAIAAKSAQAADSANMITWSISGSTAMRNFTVGVPASGTSGGLTLLETPLTLGLSNGTYSGGVNGLQLAPSTYTGTSIGTNNGTLTAGGIRAEFHESGSVEGMLELANDQIGYGSGSTIPSMALAIVDPNTPRNPTTGNPVWINRNKNVGVGTLGGYGIATSTYNTYTDYSVSGTNLLGGQNRVQMAISDVVPVQGFSKTTGTSPTLGTPIYGLQPGNTSYGKGNNALQSTQTSGLGGVSSRQQLVDDSVLNMTTNKLDPATGTFYTSGDWNTGGVSNLTTKTVAITATVFAANPGTGLTNINKTDAQWLQTAGRLKNGVDFNMSERDVNSGTRNTAALNTGVDPAWAVGENDGGNGYAADSVQQTAVGSDMKFSGKTAGGGLLRPTVQNNRMAIGVLGMSDAVGSAKNNTSTTPLRALAYSNTTDDQTANYVQPTTATVTDGSYTIWQQEQYVTVRTPDANYSSDESAKGDPNGDIVKLRDNVLASVNVHFPNNTSFNDPADQLIANSFLLPQFMIVAKTQDGGSYTDVSGNVVNGMTQAQWRTAALNPANNVTANFDTTAAANVTAGGGANYGVTSTTSLTAGATNVPITAQDSSGNATGAASAPGGNYLFGNFNQTGVRDMSAVEAAQVAQAALFAAGGAAAVDVNNLGVNNGAKIPGLSTALGHMNGGTGASKGDLVVMGDYNGDGKFNGEDLYIMAHGAAVSDAAGPGFANGTLSATAATFGDAIHSASTVLRKNAALDYMQANATAQQKVDASANPASDPTGANAFNKFDVNRDGVVNRQDAQIVDYFAGNDYRNLTQQLNAVVRTDVNPAGTAFPVVSGKAADPTDPTYAAIPRKSISLVDPELNDNGVIDESDFKLLRDDLGGDLLGGDANFDGVVDVTDLGILATDWQKSADRWSDGDFSLDGTVDVTDLGILASNWQNSVAGMSFQQALAEVSLSGNTVPEPTMLGLLCLGMLPMLRRRR